MFYDAVSLVWHFQRKLLISMKFKKIYLVRGTNRLSLPRPKGISRTQDFLYLNQERLGKNQDYLVNLSWAPL